MDILKEGEFMDYIRRTHELHGSPSAYPRAYRLYCLLNGALPDDIKSIETSSGEFSYPGRHVEHINMMLETIDQTKWEF